MEAKKAFTLVELLTVLAIITILLSLLSPATITIRRYAKETQQKAELTSTSLALTAFRNDYGDYPPSRDYGTYCGSQKLAEALLGRDLLGFHPDSQWMLDDDVYNTTEANLRQRRGRYLELTTNVFKLNDLFTIPTPLELDTFVICDVFRKREVTLANGKKVKAGTPILYYRANTSSRTLEVKEPAIWSYNIYNYGDNMRLVFAISLETEREQPLDSFDYFYDYIIDPKATIRYPYNPDTYLLISAGVDGLYGTADDITNF